MVAAYACIIHHVNRSYMKKASLCLVITLLSLGASGQALPRWNYPCKPGTPCWNALTSVAERQNACQITGIDLSTLSTEELLLITMEHPFFRSYVFHDSAIEGIDYAVDGFNGFQEFLARKDAMKTLTGIYIREDFSKVLEMKDSIQIGDYTLKWTGVELLMNNPKLQAQLSRDERIPYLKQVFEKLVLKKRLNTFFGGTSLAATALIYYALAKSIGHEFPSIISDVKYVDLFESKLIVTDGNLVKLLLADFAEFVEKK